MTERSPTSPPQATRRRIAFWLVGALAVGWLVAAGFLLWRGITSARSGASELQAARARFDLTALADSEADLGLVAAASSFRRSARDLGSPIVAPLRFVPIVGRQVKAADGLATSTAEVLDQAQALRTELTRRTDAGLPAGQQRTQFLAWLRDELQVTADLLDRLDLGPSEALVGPLHRARGDVDDNLTEARAAIADAVAASEAALALFGEESTYLVLAANNAEMRIGSGMFLSVGEMQVDDGRLRVAAFESVEDLQPAQPVPAPKDVEALWGWAEPGQEWRNLGLTPQFPVNAAMATSMWDALGRGSVDGAMAVDVVMLRLLLEVVGPVQGPDGVIDADNVESFLLHDQYLEIDDQTANLERREQLADVARAVIAALDEPGIDLARLADALRAAQRGRHLMVWSSEPEQQAGWEALGVDGALTDDSVLVGVANIDASKLDPFLWVEVEVDAEAVSDEVSEFRIATTVYNGAPPGEPPYVLGYDSEGTYDGIVVAYLPPWAEAVRVDGGEIVASGREADRLVIGVQVAVARERAQTVTMVVRGATTAARSVVLEPGARIAPVRWDAGSMFTDRHRQTVSLYGS